MAKGVFLHRPGSIYDDLPHERYHFPARYLKSVERTVGDWIVYNELMGGKGSSGYSAIAKVDRVQPDPQQPGLYFAYMEPGSYLGFEKFVPYRTGNRFMMRTVSASNKSCHAQSVKRYFETPLSMHTTSAAPSPGCNSSMVEDAPKSRLHISNRLSTVGLITYKMVSPYPERSTGCLIEA